ncbi:amino acid permease [Mesorhizobium sp. NPDC059054]|uniref:amino acid permease n=1 Tax=Mesorhizobium sp. NPDC059054 TaxID=3346711 RepID=UPI0036A1447D
MVAEKKMGLFMATMLVTVNMVGTGIFLLPATMATIGSISIYGWIAGTIGAAALAIMFAQLGTVDPQAGGPYAYARETFGRYPGFQTNYVYWSANLVGNVAVATTVVGYLTQFFPALKIPLLATICGVALIWLSVVINLVGPRFVGFITSWSAGIATVVLIIISIVGWAWFDPTIFRASWNPGNLSTLNATMSSAAIALWAFMGIESASVAAAVIENPRRNVPLATMLGLALATFLYISTCVVLMGMVPVDQLKNSEAPFSLAASHVVGTFGALAIALCAILKAGASLIGWTLTISQSAQAAADDGMFPREFGLISGSGVPIWNFIISGILMSAIIVATASASLNQQFEEVINMAVVLTLLPYLYTSVTYLKAFGLDANRKKAAFAIGVAVIATAYCLGAVAGSDADTVRSAMIFLFLSVPFYAAIRRNDYAKSPTTRHGGA